MSKPPRPAGQANRFYTGDAARLREELEEYIGAASAPAPAQAENPRPIGFVSPHAGYLYSGTTAGYVYARLRDLAPATVFVLAPSHSEAFPAPSIWDGPSYATPLGESEIDRPIVDMLAENIPGLSCQDWAERQEHSLEVQIPFLQVACPKARIVPLLIGSQSSDKMSALAKAIVKTIEENDLNVSGDESGLAFIASSDGYHGYSQNECRDSDTQLAEALESMDPEALFRPNAFGHGMACGRGPAAVVMDVSKRLGATRGVILDRSTSADKIPHAKGEWLVGYIAAMFY